MTTRTVWLVGRRRVGDKLCITEMASRTRQVAAMIERLIRQARVRKRIRNPPGGHMADVALLRRYKVPVVLAGGGYAVVTRGTRAQHLGMVDSNDRHPGSRCVAVFADIGRTYMRRVLAGCIGTVMASEAIAGDVYVIEVGRNPRDGSVAVIAVVAARDVCRILADRGGSIVA